MTKAEVVSIIANATGLTKVETEAVVNGFITTIRDSLKEGKGIEIRGFGTFKVREKKPRIARNPRKSISRRNLYLYLNRQKILKTS